MDRDTLNGLTLLGFGLILLSFFIRGFGQFVVGQEGVIRYAGPVAVVALVVLATVAVLWTLDRVGLLTLER